MKEVIQLLDIINYYEQELNMINDPSVLRVVLSLLSNAPKYYMSVNAANNPNYCKDRDGNIITLKEHTKHVARYMILLLSHPMIGSNFDNYTKDCMIGATLVHDLAKYGLNDNPSDYIKFEHPILVSKLLDLDLVNSSNELYTAASIIIDLVSTHNGPWTLSNHSDIVLPKVTTNPQYYVHICDWLASRSMLWIDKDSKLER